MKAENTTHVSQCVRTAFPSGATSTTSNIPSEMSVVVPGAIIHGDHKAPLPWSYAIDYTHEWNGSYSCYDYWHGRQLFANWSGALSSTPIQPLIAPTEIKDNIFNQALGNLSEKIRGRADLGVDAAEWHQTQTMLRNVARFERWFRGFGPKRWASEWLEYQYGWKPLMQDIYESAKQLRRHAETHIGNLQGVAIRTLTPQPQNFSSGAWINDGNVWSATPTGKGMVGCKIGVTIEVPQTDISRFSSLNPVSIAWELLPYSFVADWFLGIGDYLHLYETAWLQQTRFKSGYVSEWSFSDVSYRVPPTESARNGANQSYLPSGVSGRRIYKRFSRRILAGYPFPRVPHFEVKLGSTRLLNAAALLAQLIK